MDSFQLKSIITGKESFTRPRSVCVDRFGNIIVADTFNNRIQKIDPEGKAQVLDVKLSADSSLNLPSGIVVDQDGDIIIADTNNYTIKKLSISDQSISVLGTSGDIDLFFSNFDHPIGIATDKEGTLFVADYFGHKVFQVTKDGKISTFAGCGQQGFDDGPKSSAMFCFPFGVAVDSEGNVFVSDSGNHRIRKIDTTGLVTTVAGELQGYKDGNRKEARFDYPAHIAIDSQGNIYVADEWNNRIRRINRNGDVITIGIEENLLCRPSGIAIRPNSNILIADTLHNRIIEFANVGLSHSWPTSHHQIQITLKDKIELILLIWKSILPKDVQIYITQKIIYLELARLT